jgi:hypothetical protein
MFAGSEENLGYPPALRGVFQTVFRNIAGKAEKGITHGSPVRLEQEFFLQYSAKSGLGKARLLYENMHSIPLFSGKEQAGRRNRARV